MHISELCFVVFCSVPNSGFAIQMRWHEDFLPRNPKMFMPARKSVDGSRPQVHARRHLFFSHVAAIVSEFVFIRSFGNKAQDLARQDERTEESYSGLATKEKETAAQKRSIT